ncbi:MAG: flagellar hook-length control protein FliK [Planctomycetaceae bacterium]
MVMLVPFTTALPPQNDYSDYAPRDPDTNHECSTDETERLAAENQKDITRKPDEEPDEEDFSKVLGMLLNAAVTPEKIPSTKAEVATNMTTVPATPSAPQSTTASDVLQKNVSAGRNSAVQTQSIPRNAIPDPISNPVPAKTTASDAVAGSKAAKPEKLDTTEVRIPEIPIVGGNPESQPEQTFGERVIPINNTKSEGIDSSYSSVIIANLQTNTDSLPNGQVEFQQFGIDTTFLSGTRPYESANDTDAVTQEIMNALSRAVAASAPTKGPSGVVGPQPGFSVTEVSAMTNIAALGVESIGPVTSFGASLSDSSEELRQAGHQQSTAIGNSQDTIADPFWIQVSGPDSDHSSNQASSRDSDRTMGSLAPAKSSGADGTRLSSSGAATLTLPDLTTSVTSEMRQPLSSQVSRAVMEHIERRTTAESDTITVQLDPPDLGEMVIELSKSKDGLSVRVTAREAVTMDMLLARGSEIESHLRGEKMDLRSLEFLSPDMMSGGAFHGQTSQDTNSGFDQPVGVQRRNSRNGDATQIATGTTSRTGDSQHALNFRA